LLFGRNIKTRNEFYKVIEIYILFFSILFYPTLVAFLIYGYGMSGYIIYTITIIGALSLLVVKNYDFISGKIIGKGVDLV